MELQNVVEVSYFDENNSLLVKYQGGTVVEYHPVNAETYATIIASDSLSRVVKQTTRSKFLLGRTVVGN